MTSEAQQHQKRSEPASDTSDSEDLSPEQIDALLARAEQRLKDAQQLATSASEFNLTLPKLRPSSLPSPYVQYQENGVSKAEQKSLVDERQRKLAEKPRVINDPIAEKAKKKEKPATLAGWHDLPRTNLTPELKQDLQLLHMRGVLDPKRFYKNPGKFKIPEYSQVGTLIEGPTEFFSARLTKKERKKTFVEEALAGEAETGRLKKKYEEIMEKKKSGRKEWYKAQRARRKAGIGK